MARTLPMMRIQAAPLADPSIRTRARLIDAAIFIAPLVAVIVAAGMTRPGVCALNTAGGTCDSTMGLILAQASSSYLLDSVAPLPTFSSAISGRYSDIRPGTPITVQWNDGGSGSGFPSSTSGLASGLSVTVDSAQAISATTQVPVAPDDVGNTTGQITIDTTNLAAGIHRLTLSAVDRAGNSASQTMLFTIVQLSGSAGNALLQSASIQVNPLGTTPPPATVTFASPQVAIDATTETLNASTRVGYGSVLRPFNLGAVPVTFRNANGDSATVSVTIPSATFTHRAAIVAPAASSMIATIPASSMTLNDLTVAVPAGFDGAGSSASLPSTSVALGTASFAPGDILASVLSGKIPLIGTFGACFAGDDTTSSACSITPSAAIKLPDDVPNPIFVPIETVDDTAQDSMVVQSCVGTACSGANRKQIQHLSFVVRCPNVVIDVHVPAINLCNDTTGVSPANAWAYFQNAALYHEVTGGIHRYPIWQQNHAETPSRNTAPSCPNGASSSFRGLTYRVATNSLPGDSSTGGIVSGLTASTIGLSDEKVYLGTATGNNSTGVPPQSQDGLNYQLSNDAAAPYYGTALPEYLIAAGSYLDPTGDSIVAPDGSRTLGGTSSGWAFANASYATATSGYGIDPSSNTQGVSLHFATGTEFRSRPASSAPFSVNALVAFQVTLDYSSCGGAA